MFTISQKFPVRGYATRGLLLWPLSLFAVWAVVILTTKLLGAMGNLPVALIH